MRDSNSVGGEYCRKPHTVQILAICCGLGWATGRPLEGSLVQVGTGEGKSLILAVLSICYSFAGLQPYIACYSAYLSTRDSASFKALFELLDVRNVFYGTINQCVENVICGDELREKVSQKLDGEPCCEDWRNSGSKRILLIDEVDVFFEESFYGQSYVASLKRPSPGIKCLTDYLWEHRSDKEAIAHQQVVTTEYFKKAALSCKHFEALFSEAVRIMLQDLKDYQGNQWQVNEEKLRDTGAVEVGFVDQDCVDYSKTCDYQNMWAAYERCEVGYPEKWLAQREEHLRAAVYLLFKIGHFSYAHLAKEEFDYVLGASGTLPSEGSSESQILRDFGLTSIVRMPSVYGDCQLKFFPKGGDVVASDNHFTQLMQEVEKRRDGGKRAVLVFFESAAVLNDYMKRAGDTQSFTVTRMVEGFSHAEKARLTLSAATPGTVTFATRTYGRGTDFVVHDSRLLEAGGIHGIQTFMGSASEHIQIKGRQARQGQNGSFSMVLDAERLEALQISAETATTMSKESSLYENLVKKSSEHVGRTLESQGAEMKSLELLHHASMDLRSKLHKLSPAEVTSALLPRNKGPRTGQRSRSLILLDGTGSMGGLIHSAKAVLCETFKRLFATMHDAGVTTEFALQLAIYRNYNHKPFVHSKWSSSAEPLLEFISPVVVEGGYGEEAVELGLQHAANENEADGVSQVILMGDAPANPSDRWPEMTTDYAREADRLAAKSVPVHTFVLADWARTNFEDISKRTGGTSCSLDVNSPGASDIILNHWSTCVLEDIGGSDLVEVYKKKYSYA
ncbi:Protein translocase subunit SecA [Diplonema papillatum]|nr:Protein translocase subunit SecA [Diplonema papillatum]